MNLVNQDETSLLMKQCSLPINHQSNEAWVLHSCYNINIGGKRYKSIATDVVLLRWPNSSIHKWFPPLPKMWMLLKSSNGFLFNKSLFVFLCGHFEDDFFLKKTFALRHKSHHENALSFLDQGDFATKWTTSLSGNDNTAKEYLCIKNWNTTNGSLVSLVKSSFSRENPSHFTFNDFVLVVPQMYWRKKSVFLAPSVRKLNKGRVRKIKMEI